jgi:AAA domain
MTAYGKDGRKPLHSIHNVLHERPDATGGDFTEADNALKSIKEHLNRGRIALQQRRAYVVEPRYWRYNIDLHRLEIDANYFAGMSAGSSFAFNSDAKTLEARPNIQAEFVTILSANATKEIVEEIVGRSSRDKAPRLEISESKMKRFRDSEKSAFGRTIRIMTTRAVTEHFIELEDYVKELDWLKDCDPSQQMLWFEQSDYVWRKKRDFAERLHTQPDEHHLNLKRLFIQGYAWPSPPQEALPNDAWIDKGLKDATSDGTKEQRSFVEKALNSQDFTFVWGPAGSGKTTAICEFVRQCVQRGQRVLMVASTHVAVDNVLTKLMIPAGNGLKEVIPVRVGRGEKVDPKVKSRMMDNFLLDEIKQMLASLEKSQLEGRAQSSAQLMRKSLEKLAQALRQKTPKADQDPLAKLILGAANFVCGTSLGILQHPTIRGGIEGGDYPIWDHLILDEASKTTLDEFLVPALCARRWVIVGDPYQLAPYCDNGEIGSALLADLSCPTQTNDAENQENLEHGIPDNLKRNLAEVIQFALDERSTHLGGGIFWEEAKANYMAALNKLRSSSGEMGGILARRLEQVLPIITPSVLESLITEKDSSSLSSILTPFPKPALAERMVRLEFQHRMDRRIADFCRHHVYKGRQLITATHVHRPALYGAEHERLVLLEAAPSAQAMLDTLPSPKSDLESPHQAALALHEVLTYAQSLESVAKEQSAYIISTYRRQNQLIRRVVEYVSIKHSRLWCGLTVTANTVDSCQGHEADLVVLSMVRTHQTAFMRSTNRMNVAFTRAKSKMVIVGPLPAQTKEGRENPDDRTLLDCLPEYADLIRSKCANSDRLRLAIQLTREALAQNE